MTRTRLVIIAMGCLTIGIQFVRPARTNPPTRPADHLLAHLAVPSDAARVLARACRDCHSNDTAWPWYSHVAPVSWWVIEHVDHGRSYFNYSTWGTYPRARQASLLEQSCTLAKGADMPLASYLLMHGSARLSAEDTAVLCRWSLAAADLYRSNAREPRE